MKFQVPQFIEVEDKLFGPLTLKQFLYLAGGGAAVFLLYVIFPFFIFIFFAIPVGGFAAALAFYKVNDKPFIKVVENALKHYTSPKIYTWKKGEAPETKNTQKTQPAAQQQITAPALTKSKLSDLAWSLDIKKQE